MFVDIVFPGILGLCGRYCGVETAHSNWDSCLLESPVPSVLLGLAITLVSLITRKSQDHHGLICSKFVLCRIGVE